MKHFTSTRFWRCYQQLPTTVRDLADKNFLLLQQNPSHPSLQFKKIGKVWSARVGVHYRAIAAETDKGLVWLWIGSHADYDKLFS
ncbi:hypothetical protein [Nitrosospira sp. Nsp1]|uniref:ParE family toxin-like protein n=1 Tax=Nitrosospira sp. Nsp1 TaxID=136547 RepID=UPI000B859530|nr:hypothetical protein [Nitrosospira sp. Nsp1]